MLLDLEYCEICGKHRSIFVLHEHHIKHRAAGGQDIEENILKACGECHTKCHAGNIKLWEQIEIVSRRMEKTPEVICTIIGLLDNKVLPRDYVFNEQGNPLIGMSYEEVLQLVFSYKEVGETAIWGLAEIFSGMVAAGANLKKMSSDVGCSPATIREYVRTYRAFPDESTRALDKTFTHHRIASKTPDPVAWIEKTCQEDLSTRQLEEAIKTDGKDEVIIKDIRKEKAERVIRMINEIMTDPDDVTQWLHSEIKTIFEGSEIYGTNEIAC